MQLDALTVEWNLKSTGTSQALAHIWLIEEISEAVILWEPVQTAEAISLLEQPSAAAEQHSAAAIQRKIKRKMNLKASRILACSAAMNMSAKLKNS